MDPLTVIVVPRNFQEMLWRHVSESSIIPFASRNAFSLAKCGFQMSRYTSQANNGIVSSWIRSFLLLAGFCGLVLAIFLSLRTSPALTTLSWIPRWLANWCDHHGSTRNFPAFVLMALPFLLVIKRSQARAWTMAALAVLAVLLEAAQLFIPTRVADIRDILSSWLGLLVAWAVVEAIRFLIRKTGNSRVG